MTQTSFFAGTDESWLPTGVRLVSASKPLDENDSTILNSKSLGPLCQFIADKKLLLRNDPWQGNWIYCADRKKQIFQEALGDNGRNFLRANGRPAETYRATRPESWRKFVQKERSENPMQFFSVDSEKRKLGEVKMCSDFGLFFSCASAIEEVYNNILSPNLPGEHASITSGYEVLLDILNGAYWKGYLEYAKILAERLQGRDPNPAGDVFSDLVSSFVRTGSTRIEAQKKTIRTLGLIASSGANFENRMTDLGLEIESEILFLKVLSVSLPFLDYQRSSGWNYSTPEGIRADCDDSKTYHFWMTAYLAQELQLKGYKPREIAGAVLATHVGYRLVMENEMIFMTDEDPGLPIFQADLTYALTGILFGLDPAQEKIKISTTFEELFGKLRPDLTPVDPQIEPLTLEAYSAFRKKYRITESWKWLQGRLATP